MTRATLRIALSGSINESTDFSQIEDLNNGNLEINCKDITAINSFGIRSWLKIFKVVRGLGIKLKFIDVSPALARHLGLIEGLILPDEIQSLCVEFICQECSLRAIKAYSPDELKKMNFVLPQFQCPECRKEMEFDDIPDEYFSFLKKV